MHRHHVLLITYPAQGHINPSLQLAKRLINLGARVTVSTTVHMHRRMSDKPSIRGLSFVPFSDGFDDGFTLSDDSNYDHYMTEYERRGTEFVTDLINSAAEEGQHPFTCVVYTFLQNWVAEAARAFHLPSVVLWPQPAVLLDIHYYYFHGYRDYINEKITKEPSSCSLELPGLPRLQPSCDLPSFYLESNNSISKYRNSFIASLIEKQFRHLDQEVKPRILANTFEALEPDALRAVDDKLDVIPIGPLIPSAFLDVEKDGDGDSSYGGNIFKHSNDYVEWLDSQAERSVVYVSFGSFWVLAKKQMEEMARALLDSRHPFLWVIRKKEKKEKEKEEEEDEELSCREELEARGKIVEWCSQVEVLSHGSLGCFVTHCGWNSTMESLASGVPMVAFPQWVDQKTNAKLIEDVWKTGVRVDREEEEEEGVVEAGEIKRCVEVVMGSGEKAKELRENADKWKMLAREAVKEGGSSEQNLRTFLHQVHDLLPQSR
ncbi:phloretin 4'-O-glucosyltransferase-like [Arachis stenosperma]|uniref:phloretin 4'-O-glucosyltransferase-like n=1 Tax=Arachis stenosperma TaxID=217475 RepID=UPI0025ABECEE|nr:phloretin 4'-O-glucosyltransferase-like [Arachis stenosperma]